MIERRSLPWSASEFFGDTEAGREARLGLQSSLEAAVERAAVERAAVIQAAQAEAAVLRGLVLGLCQVDIAYPGYSIVCDGQPVAMNPCDQGFRRFYLHGPLDPWPFRWREIPVERRRR